MKGAQLITRFTKRVVFEVLLQQKKGKDNPPPPRVESRSPPIGRVPGPTRYQVNAEVKVGLIELAPKSTQALSGCRRGGTGHRVVNALDSPRIN